jgi:hypothetical protein
MKRRDLLVISALTVLLTANSEAFAQAAEKVWRLCVLSLIDNPTMHSATLSELAAQGFVEGRNLVVDMRIGTAERMPALARELVSARPDVIMALSDWAVYPAREATKSIPIVASPMGADPVAAGVAESWARPGGNVTGVTLIAPEPRSSGWICCARSSRPHAASRCCRCTARSPNRARRQCAEQRQAWGYSSSSSTSTGLTCSNRRSPRCVRLVPRRRSSYRSQSSLNMYTCGACCGGRPADRLRAASACRARLPDRLWSGCHRVAPASNGLRGSSFSGCRRCRLAD